MELADALFKKHPFIYETEDDYYLFGAGVCKRCTDQRTVAYYNEYKSYISADNLAALLCLKHTGRLADVLTTLGPIVLADYEPMPFGLRPREVPERVGKGYNGFKHAAIPDMPWAKELLSMKSLARMPFLSGS